MFYFKKRQSMKQVKSFFQRYLHNGEHDQLHNELSNLIDNETAVKLGIVNEVVPYQAARANEKLALQADVGSAYTLSVTEADGYRDETDLGFCLFVESNLHYPDPAIQENARKIMRIIDQYGNLRKLNYNDESSQLTNRNTEIINKYANELSSLGGGWGTAWLNALTEANNQFAAHFGTRANDITNSKVDINTLESRAATDAAWEAIAQRINALVVVNGEAPYAAFIDKANYYIDYNKSLVNARKAKKEKKGTTDTKTETGTETETEQK